MAFASRVSLSLFLLEMTHAWIETGSSMPSFHFLILDLMTLVKFLLVSPRGGFWRSFGTKENNFSHASLSSGLATISSKMSTSNDEHVARADFGIRFTRALVNIGCLSGKFCAVAAVGAVFAVLAGVVNPPVAGVAAVTVAGVMAAVLLWVVATLYTFWAVDVDIDDNKASGGLGV